MKTLLIILGIILGLIGTLLSIFIRKYSIARLIINQPLG